MLFSANSFSFLDDALMDPMVATGGRRGKAVGRMIGDCAVRTAHLGFAIGTNSGGTDCETAWICSQFSPLIKQSRSCGSKGGS
jgi:hypothetical protein